MKFVSKTKFDSKMGFVNKIEFGFTKVKFGSKWNSNQNDILDPKWNFGPNLKFGPKYKMKFGPKIKLGSKMKF